MVNRKLGLALTLLALPLTLTSCDNVKKLNRIDFDVSNFFNYFNISVDFSRTRPSAYFPDTIYVYYDCKITVKDEYSGRYNYCKYDIVDFEAEFCVSFKYTHVTGEKLTQEIPLIEEHVGLDRVVSLEEGYPVSGVKVNNNREYIKNSDASIRLSRVAGYFLENTF